MNVFFSLSPNTLYKSEEVVDACYKAPRQHMFAAKSLIYL